MIDSKILELIEEIYAQSYDTDEEIETEELEELLSAIECELRERDEE